jgi:hypothetical protein
VTPLASRDRCGASRLLKNPGHGHAGCFRWRRGDLRDKVHPDATTCFSIARKASRTLHCRSARGSGRFNRLMRLCPSIHTFSHERIPSGHSGERAITSRPLVRASGRTCESNHYATLWNRLPCPVGLAGSPHNSRRQLTGFFNSLLGLARLRSFV